MNMSQAGGLLRERIVSLFLPDPVTGQRPIHAADSKYATDPHFKDL